MGRRTKYTDKLAAEICERLSAGETLRSICRDERMPKWQTVYQWMEGNGDFADRIARAREVGFDAIAAEALEIADEEPECITGDGGTRRDGGYIAWQKNRVWTRLQLLAKWSPQKYGDKTSMAVTGADGGPVQISDADRAARVAGILAVAAQRRADDSTSDDE